MFNAACYNNYRTNKGENMKLLTITLLLLTFTSCALKPRYTYSEPQKPTTLEKIENCTYRLIEQNGVDAKTSQETCNNIFIRK